MSTSPSAVAIRVSSKFRRARADTWQAALPPEFFCAITMEVMRDPVTTFDGLSYERAAIESWLREHDTSPLTGEPLPSKMLIPNTALRNQIRRVSEHGSQAEMLGESGGSGCAARCSG